MAGGRGHVGQALRAMENSDAAFSMCNGRLTSRRQFFSRVAALSEGLHRLGLQSGDRVAIAALNSDWYLEWMLAVPCAGGIVAPLNYRWSVEEANEAVQLIHPVMLVVDEQCISWCDFLRSKCPSIHTVVLIGEICRNNIGFIHAESVIHSFGSKTELALNWAPNGIALVCFTSGTTGTPKGVSVTHNALIMQSLAKLAIVGYSSKDIYLHTAPLCHIGGISSALATLMAGSYHVVLAKFEAESAFKALREFSISTMIVVPTMLKDLVHFMEVTKGEIEEDTIFPSMNIMLNGAGGIPSGILNSVVKMFPNARLFSAYGMTETSSSITFVQVHDPKRNDLQVTAATTVEGVCVGKPAPHVEIRIKDASKGNVLTRGPHVMKGYWGQPKETDAVLSKDGWLDTGDVGRIDEDGNLWLLGRAKDTIKTGGENVYASEVEAVLAQHPSISMVAVIGLPDVRLNEIVAAVVVLKEGWTWTSHPQRHALPLSRAASTSILRLHCSKVGLSRYKIPKFIVQQTGPLPMTSTGKIKKDIIKSSVISSMKSRELPWCLQKQLDSGISRL